MKQKNLSRITIDIPEDDHKKFKVLAAVLGKSMRELVIESIQEHLERSQPLFTDTKSKK